MFLFLCLKIWLPAGNLIKLTIPFIWKLGDLFTFFDQNPANIYLRNVNDRNTRKRCEVCSTLTVKSPERHQWYYSGVFTLTLTIFCTFFKCFYWWLWTSRYYLGTSLVQLVKWCKRYIQAGTWVILQKEISGIF